MRAWAHLLKFHSGQRNGSWSSSQRILEGPFHLKTMLEPVEVCGCIYHLKVMNVTVLFRPSAVLNNTLYLFCCFFLFFLSCCPDLRKAFFSFCDGNFLLWLLTAQQNVLFREQRMFWGSFPPAFYFKYINLQYPGGKKARCAWLLLSPWLSWIRILA